MATAKPPVGSAVLGQGQPPSRPGSRRHRARDVAAAASPAAATRPRGGPSEPARATARCPGRSRARSASRASLESRAVGGEAGGERPGKGRLGILTLQIDAGIAADAGKRKRRRLEDCHAALTELDAVHAVARDGARDYGEGG